MDEKTLKLFLDRMKEDGCSTLGVKDGQFIAFRRDKLEELLKALDACGKDHAMIFIKTIN